MSEYEKKIEEMQQDFQFTLSKVSHEIRNPVTLIHSFLQMMADKYPQVETFDYWDDIQENMEFLIDLLNELSTYNNSFRLNCEPLDLTVFLNSIVESSRPTLTYLNIQLHACIPENLPVLSCDKTKLKQAILNIIRNASEAISQEGTITLEAKKVSQELQIIITDTGSGIPSEYLKDLFQPFITHKEGGTGLGLPIANQVLQAHGGTIHVSSQEGVGTTFILTLPTNSSCCPQ